MNKKTIYLCGPIAHCSDDECMGWRDEVTNQLKGKYNILNPMIRDYRNQETNHIAADIVEADLKDINNSDIVLAFVDRPSTGTSMEIFYAFGEGKEVVTINDKERPSPWLFYHSTQFFKKLTEAIDYLKNET